MAKLACITSLMVLLSFAFVVHSADNCVYTVFVKTSNIESAGTDAKVSLMLYDKEGSMVNITNLQERELMGKGHDYFERDNLDVFAIKNKCLDSPVCKIVLSHDNTGHYPGWHVDYLEVNTAQPQRFCNHLDIVIQQWLSDTQLSVTRDECPSTHNRGKGNDIPLLLPV